MQQCRACGEVYETNHNCSENRPPEPWEMVEDIQRFLDQATEEAERSDEASKFLAHSPYRVKLATAKIALMNLRVELDVERPVEEGHRPGSPW